MASQDFPSTMSVVGGVCRASVGHWSGKRFFHAGADPTISLVYPFPHKLACAGQEH